MKTTDSMKLYNCITLASRLIVAFLLVISGVNHVKNPYFFLDSIFAYNLVSSDMGVIAASVLPFLQILVGLLLFMGNWAQASWLCAGTLFSIFGLAQLFVVITSGTIDCGCFGSEWSMEIGYTSVAFVSTLAAISWFNLAVHRREFVSDTEQQP